MSTLTLGGGDSFPRSVEEAKEHIRQIRRDKGLGDEPDQVGNNASDLQSALQVLSHDLYQTSTHFLLELIQNADDNSYDTETPTLLISYTPGKIRIHCNERGFTRNNLEAICRICKSTKSGRSKTAGFVGEKGIGFKSVFKVASVVWIKSGHYSFKFNRDGHLGMIAPIWEKYPGQPRKNGTSICLQLAKDCDEKRIVEELASYDEKILLFLRRLRRLEISVRPPRLSFARCFDSILARQEEALGEKNSNHAVLLRNGEKKNFFVWRHMADKMPKEARRPGISSSEIVVAFPYKTGRGKDDIEPECEAQSVYAFLPIRNCGFPFLLQADFLLSANREDVQDDSPWNQTLSSEVTKAFVKAVQAMGNLDNALRWKWMSYRPGTTSQTAFFETIRLEIHKSLGGTPVLESESGSKLPPSKLMYVPAELRDRHGRPLLEGHNNPGRFVSSSYIADGTTWQSLRDLGVVEQTSSQFSQDLTAALKGDAASFMNKKSSQWQDDLAKALVLTGIASSYSQIPIIPLQDGSWVSPHGNNVFFPNQTLTKVPDGLDICIIDHKAAVSTHRRDLCKKCGVGELNSVSIRTMILAAHTGTKPKAAKLSPEVLLSHVVFFFDMKSELAQPSMMQVATEAGEVCASNTVYRHSDEPGSASSVLKRSGRRHKYGFLHPIYTSYGNTPARRAEFQEYLVEQLSVATFPRFISPYSSAIHPDFTALMEHDDKNLWLEVLKDGWEYYEASFSRVKSLLAKQQVRTLGGKLKPLSETWMPWIHLLKEFGKVVSFIDVSDVDNERWWSILPHLAVGMCDNVRFYTRCLESARRDDSVSDDQIRGILHNLEDRAETETDASGIGAMRMSFLTNELVFIPALKPSGQRLWVSPNECFWRGEPWLTQSVGLAAIHPDLETLFRTHVKISDSNNQHIVKEAEALSLLSRPVPYDRVVKIILALNKLAKKNELRPYQIDEMKKLAIFPIVTTPQNEPYEYLTSVDSKKPWLIADRAHLRQHFRDVVPVLAFKPEFIFKIRKLLQVLGLEERFLSKLASSVTEALGEVTPSKKLTSEYRERAKHLFRLIPTDQDNIKQLVASYNRMQVYTSSKVVQYWQANLGLQSVQSAHTEGVVFLEVDFVGDLRLYLRAGYEEEQHPSELAEQLRTFFNVPYEHLDLLTVALSAPDERIELLFDARGISPWFEDDAGSEHGEDDSEVAVYDPVLRPGPSKKSRLRIKAEARFSSLFGPTRFTPGFFKNGKPGDELPSYNAAVVRSAQNAIGRPAEPRTFTTAMSLPSLKGSLRNLDFTQTGAAIVGTRSKPMTLLDRFKILAQRGPDVGETIVSDILTTVLGSQYDKERMWAAKDQRKNGLAAFNFTDVQGRFSGFLMRLDGMSGKAQGYTRLIYHLDVKTSDDDQFKMTQDELNRARDNSVHSQPDPEEAAPSKHVSVLVLISDVRSEPKIRFLADPWDLFEDGQLILQNPKTYHAKLNLRLRQAAKKPAEESGFDAVQFKAPEDAEEAEPAPDYEEGSKKAMKRPEVSWVDEIVSAGEKAVAGPSGTHRSSGVR